CRRSRGCHERPPSSHRGHRPSAPAGGGRGRRGHPVRLVLDHAGRDRDPEGGGVMSGDAPDDLPTHLRWAAEHFAASDLPRAYAGLMAVAANAVEDLRGEVGALCTSRDDLLAIVARFVALPSGAWQPERRAAEEIELMEAARAAIAKATG